MKRRDEAEAQSETNDNFSLISLVPIMPIMAGLAPWPPPPRVSCESRETSGTDGESAVLILICMSPKLSTMAAQRSDSDNMQKRGKTFHLIYFRMNIQQKIAV